MAAVLPPPAPAVAPARALDRPHRPRGAAGDRLRWSSSWRCRCWRSCARRCRTRDGDFVGLANFVALLRDAGAAALALEQLWVSALVTLITVPLAFGFAYALTRSCMPVKALFRGIALIPLLAPSLLSAISLIYWFGNQGVAKGCMHGARLREIYGAPGIVRRRVLRGLPACADDPGDARWRCPTRASTKPPTRWARRPGASSSPSRCRARSTA